MPKTDDSPAVDDLPRRGNPRLRGLLAKVSLLAATMALVMVTLEIATRLLSDVVPPLLVAHPVVCKTYLPGFEGDVYVDECDRHVHLRFQNDGFRGPERSVEKPSGVRRAAVLGDSMIAAIATDESQTLVEQLQALLNAEGGDVTWEVMNFGVSGSSPGQQLVLYRNIVAKYQPDVVLCAFFVGNDLSDMSSRIGTNPHLYFDVDEQDRLFQEPYSSARATATQWLNRHSRFYIWQKLALNRTAHQARRMIRQRAAAQAKPPTHQAKPRAGDGRWLDPGQWVYLSQETEDVAHAWKITGKVIEQFQREVTAAGGRFAVLVVPSPEQIYDDYFGEVARAAGSYGAHFDAAHPDRRLADLCALAGAPIILLRERFREFSPAHRTDVVDQRLFIGGRGHFNDAGNRVAAEGVFEFLTRPSPQLAGRPWADELRRR